MTNKNALEKINMEISRFVLTAPLYYVPLSNMVKVEDENIKTMAVGPYKDFQIGLFYSPKFVESLDSWELKSILKHEALHILLQHITRAQARGSRMKMYNIAADLTINPRLTGLPDWVYYPEKVDLPNHESAEYYYSALKKRRDKFIEQLGGDDDDFIRDLAGDLLDDHSMWDDISEEEKYVLSEKIRDIAERAMKSQDAQGWGSEMGGLAEQIIAANKPVVNWKRELRYFVNKEVTRGRTSTRTRPNRRYGYLQPGSKKHYTTRILVALDTSGSVSKNELSMFGDELPGITKQVICDLVSFDTVVHGEPVELKRNQRLFDIYGRGGTDFDPVFKLAKEKKYNALIIFSDGMAPFPEQPKFRTLWALTPSAEGKVNPPFGKTIYIKDKSL